MSRIRRFAPAAALGLSVVLSNPAFADPPWKLIGVKRVDADPERAYPLTEDHGPWMIMCSTFAGEGAKAQAEELVLELRKRYKMNAFIHEQSFDFSQPVEGRGVDERGRPLKMKYRRNKKIDEYAVLVGNFLSPDDSDTQKALQKLKYLKPTALDTSDGRVSYQQLAAYRSTEKVAEGDGKILAIFRSPGPMGHAFITRNPMLPEEYFKPKGLDKFVEKLNSHKGIKYSLLNCPGKYTVKVATFVGAVVMKPQDVKRIEAGEEMKSMLDGADMKAHNLCLALRAKGYEAYEFHDRNSSLVTVGSFNSVGTPRPDGKIEINPRIHAVIQTFSSNKESTKLGQTVSGQKLIVIAGIPLDPQPMIVEVPKRTLASDYAQPRD